MRNFQSMQVITNLRTISGTLEKYTYFLRNSYKFRFATFFFWLVCLMLTFSTLVLHSTESKLKISMVLRIRPLPSFQHPIVKRILVYRYTQYTLLLVRLKFCKSFVCLDKQFFQEERSGSIFSPVVIWQRQQSSLFKEWHTLIPSMNLKVPKCLSPEHCLDLLERPLAVDSCDYSFTC